MPGKTVAISINASWNIFNFRAGLIRALRAEGYEVVALSPPDAYAPRLAELGARHVAVPMDSAGVSPVQDLRPPRPLPPRAQGGSAGRVPRLYGQAQRLGLARRPVARHPDDQQRLRPRHRLHPRRPADQNRLRPLPRRLPPLGDRVLPERRGPRPVRFPPDRRCGQGGLAARLRHRSRTLRAASARGRGGQALRLPDGGAAALGQRRARICRGGADRAGPSTRRCGSASSASSTW
jgi:hypothetical protein